MYKIYTHSWVYLSVKKTCYTTANHLKSLKAHTQPIWLVCIFAIWYPKLTQLIGIVCVQNACAQYSVFNKYLSKLPTLPSMLFPAYILCVDRSRFHNVFKQFPYGFSNQTERELRLAVWLVYNNSPKYIVYMLKRTRWVCQLCLGMCLVWPQSVVRWENNTNMLNGRSSRGFLYSNIAFNLILIAQVVARRFRFLWVLSQCFHICGIV